MSLEYKSDENANILNAEEQYILCIASCISTKLDKVREPLTTSIFNKFPEANIYKERQLVIDNKGKPGSLIIRGKVAIILGTMYPGSKEYNNDNRDFRLKWFREGLIALQRLNPRSIAIRENFCDEFGGDWNKYLFHLNEMDKSIKVSIYPHIIVVPIFNVVRFKQETDNIILPKNNVKTVTSPIPKANVSAATPNTNVVTPKTSVNAATVKVLQKKGNGFGSISDLSKFSDNDDNHDNDDNADNTKVVAEKNLPDKSLPKLKVLQPIKKILPIKIQDDTDNERVTNTLNKEIISDNEEIEKVKVEEKVDEKVEEKVEEKVKSYIANPEWSVSQKLSLEMIYGWDEIFNEKGLEQSLEKANDFLFNKELPQYGDFFSIFPPQKDIFNAFNQCSFEKARVVILGQDSYINRGEAMGLSFSVPKGVKIPPSLKNIYKELKTDIPGFEEPNHGNLMHWANQGVFLLNSALTVREGKSGSHLEAWEAFTDGVISLISQKKQNLVFILWGNPAKKKQNVIKNIDNHCIVTAAHPSPLSATKGFFGSKCFSQTNNYLISKGLKPIDWSIPPANE